MSTSLGYKLNKQPIAQSFFIDEVNGIYCTKIDLFFETKDTSFPVSVQIRPMVNGYPSSDEVLPGTHIVVPGASVNTSSDATSATTFAFPEPVFLKGLTDYAIVVTADSPDYKIYIAETNAFLVGSTERRVDRQPILGSLFYSQNSATFTASQNQDLTFKLYQAVFDTATIGKAVFNNAALPKRLLDVDPISVDSGSSTVTVSQYNHGLLVGNTVNISDVDSSGVGGISHASLVGNRTITAIDNNGFQFTADSSATSSVIGGGSNVKSTKNIPYSIMYPHMQYLKPTNTDITAAIKGTTSKSLAGTETSFRKASSYNAVRLNNNNEADELYLVANTASETAELGSGVKSLDMEVSLYSTDANVSPMLDLQRASASLINYVIDKQDSAATVGFNVPLNYVDETNPNSGSSSSKHITRAVTLAEEAVGAKVLFAANRPSAADIQVYYRFATGDEVLSDKNFVLATEETNNPSDENRRTFREYQYLIGGPGGNLDPFSQMQFKFVFRSTNAARVPVMKDLRIIALSV